MPRIGFDLASMIVDPRRDRLVLYGGVDGDGNVSTDVWVKPLSGGTPWTRLDIADPLPMARAAHAAIYDPVRDRMVVFGDTYSDSAGSVWALSLSGSLAWSKIALSGTGPGYRSGVRGIYDPTHDRMIVFGGYSAAADSLMNDVWALSLAGTPAWSRLIPDGSPPTRRELVALTYDPIGQRMIVFGGYQDLRPDGPPAPCRDVWALSLTDTLTWTRLLPVGDVPPALYNCASAYDPVRGRMLVYGGTGSSFYYSPHPETWALQLGDSPAWMLLVPPGDLPPGRAGACAVYDSTRDRLVVFGGSGSDTWALPLSGTAAWTELEPGDGFGPGGRYLHSAVYDSTRRRVLLFAGTFFDYGTGLDPTNHQLNDLWALTFEPRAKWQPVLPGVMPPPGAGHSVILDPAADRLIVFGGTVQDPSDFGPGDIDSNEVWQIPLSAAGPATMIAAGDSMPSARELHTAVYDPLRRRMLVFGGCHLPDVFGDVWILSLDEPPRWTRLEIAGPGPSPRYGHATIYDPVGDRMIVFGGNDGTTKLDDTWQLTLAGTPAWSPLPSAVRPSARSQACVVYDSRRQRMVLFGGNGCPGDTWVFPLADGAGWEPAVISGSSPAPRFAAAAVFDPDEDRVVLLDGFESYPTLDYDSVVWTMTSAVPVPAPLQLLRVHAGPWRVVLAWQGGGSPAITATVERRTASSAWAALGTAQPDATGALAYEDMTAAPGSRYGYRLAWTVGAAARTTLETWVEVPRLQFALAGSTPNPTTQGITVLFSLPDASAARLEIVDIAGRRVLSRDVGGLGPGDHALSVAMPGAIRPGVYLIRLSRGAEALVKRVCVIR